MRPKAEWVINSDAMRARGIIVLVIIILLANGTLSAMLNEFAKQKGL